MVGNAASDCSKILDPVFHVIVMQRFDFKNSIIAIQLFQLFLVVIWNLYLSKGDIGCPFSTRWYDSLGPSWNGLSDRVKQHPFYLVKNSSVHSDSFRCISLYMLMSTAHPASLLWKWSSLSLNFLTKPALNYPSFRKQSWVKWFAQPGINEFSESDVWPSLVM